MQPDAADGGRDAFFRLWTLKEALIRRPGKASGARSRASPLPLTPLRSRSGPDRRSVRSVAVLPGPADGQHVVATAVRRAEGPEVSFVAAGVVPDDTVGTLDA